jgi:mRNA interferase RelE/StbE
VRAALKDLGRDRGDICPLDGSLTGYNRLRVGRHRILFQYAADGAIEAVFIAERSLVYDLFEAEFIKKLRMAPLVAHARAQQLTARDPRYLKKARSYLRRLRADQKAGGKKSPA